MFSAELPLRLDNTKNGANIGVENSLDLRVLQYTIGHELMLLINRMFG